MADLSITRRSLMSAMAVAPIAISVPTIASRTTSTNAAWDVAFAEWKQAHRIAFEGPADIDADDRRCEAESAAWTRLMKTPAPDNKALHWKLNYLWGEPNGNEYCDQWATDIVQFVLADAKRLAGL